MNLQRAHVNQYIRAGDIVSHDWSVEHVGSEIVARLTLSRLVFDIAAGPRNVWRFLKDFNLWQEDLHYENVIGEQTEGGTSSFAIKPAFYEHFKRHYPIDPETFKKRVVVRKSVPDRLLVVEAPSADGRKIDSYYLWALHEGAPGMTTVSGLMVYAPLWAPQSSEATIRRNYQALVDEVEARWKQIYIPRLRQLVEQSVA